MCSCDGLGRGERAMPCVEKGCPKQSEAESAVGAEELRRLWGAWDEDGCAGAGGYVGGAR